jgi:murein L,D-transpeptidase YcbB/YkuD
VNNVGSTAQPTTAQPTTTTTKAATTSAQPTTTTTKAATTSAQPATTTAQPTTTTTKAATTTTKVQTTKIPKLALEDIYTDFFRLGLEKSSLTATKTTFKSLLTTLSVNTAQVDSYIAALEAYLAVVVENPTDAQKTAMTSKLDLFDTAEENFVKSFQGLAAGLADPFFLLQPNNAEFNRLRTLSSGAKTTLRLNPATTYSFFTNPATVTAFAEYTVAAIAVSDRIKAGG